jgi:hypothetical protein
MDTTWGSYHRRQQILRDVVARVERTGEVDKPWVGVRYVWLEFEGEGEVLAELQHWWLRVLIAHLHRADLTGCPECAYDDATAAHPALCAVLDAHADHPALAEGLRREREFAPAAVA